MAGAGNCACTRSSRSSTSPCCVRKPSSVPAIPAARARPSKLRQHQPHNVTVLCAHAFSSAPHRPRWRARKPAARHGDRHTTEQYASPGRRAAGNRSARSMDERTSGRASPMSSKSSSGPIIPSRRSLKTCTCRRFSGEQPLVLDHAARLNECRRFNIGHVEQHGGCEFHESPTFIRPKTQVSCTTRASSSPTVRVSPTSSPRRARSAGSAQTSPRWGTPDAPRGSPASASAMRTSPRKG